VSDGLSPDTATAARLWADAVVANGGTVSSERLAIVSAFIRAETAMGRWALTDDYWGLWAENEAQALTSLRQLRLATAVAAPTFTPDRGYVFNGVTQYIDTGFVPSTHAIAMTLNSVHAEVYERTNLSDGNNISFGGGSGSNRSVAVAPRAASACRGFSNSSFAAFTLPAADSRGLTQMGRAGAATTDAYGAKNGVNMTRTSAPAALGASLPAHSFYIGAFDSAGVLSSARAASVGYTAAGAALSEAQRLARYNAVQAWAVSVGANV
jgi:hypothetical protein